jgi:hypothetical protein
LSLPEIPVSVTDFGWINAPHEVERVVTSLPTPMITSSNAPSVNDKKDVLLYEFVRKVIGQDAPKGPQKIGDCVSWGWGNLVNYIACLQIFKALKAQNLVTLPDPVLVGQDQYNAANETRQAIIAEYQEAATEVIYALSRVEIGGQRGSYSDGSVGAWAAKAVSTMGTLSRKYLDSKGLGGEYNPNRAKDWGAKGLPDNLEPDAAKHLVKTVSLVTSFDQAAGLIQNGYPVAICSNRGFTMERDAQGFCSPSGVWNHCMLLVGVRFDRPGCCISQSWGANTPTGPLGMNQPDNTFWADASVIEYILRQQDSFTGSEFLDYPNQDLITWAH